MIKINGKTFNTDVEQILKLLRLESNDKYFKEIKSVGDYYMTNCPFHKDGQEKKPSCGFHKEKSYAHCFTCGEKRQLGDVIAYITNKGALEWLEEQFEVAEIENKRNLNLFKKKEKDNKKDNIDISKYRVFHPYMFERKLTKEVVRKYDIGFDKESNCIVFPNKDENGNILFLARRSIKTKYFNYPSGAEKPIYGLYELKRDFPNTNYVIVCESMLDALSFVVAGKPAVALNGLGSYGQIKKLNSLPQRKIILCTDMDENGINARERIAKGLTKKMVYEYNLPTGKKDANDCSIEELQNLKEVRYKR